MSAASLALVSMLVWISVPDSPVWAEGTIDQMIAQAIVNNPAVAAARRQWEAVAAEIPQAGALEDPELSVTQWSIPSGFNVIDADQTWYGVSQAVPFPGKRPLRSRIAKRAAEAAEQDYLATVRDVRARVKTTYARLYRVQRAIATHRQHQALLDELIQIALERYSAGEVPQQESLKAQVELSSLHATLLGLDQEQQSVRIELNTHLGRPDDPLFEGDAHIAFVPLLVPIDTLRAGAGERPELKRAGRLVARQEEAVALAQRRFHPDFMAEVSYWDVHDGPNRWMVTGKMNLPWLWSGKHRADIAQERAELARVRAERDAARNETNFLVRDLFLKVKAAETAVDLYRHGIVAQAEHALESARIAYGAGQTDFLNVIEAERRLRDVRLAADVALADWAEDRAELERVVGKRLE